MEELRLRSVRGTRREYSLSTRGDTETIVDQIAVGYASRLVAEKARKRLIGHACQTAHIERFETGDFGERFAHNISGFQLSAISYQIPVF